MRGWSILVLRLTSHGFSVYRFPVIDLSNQTVVLANGQFPKHAYPLSVLRGAARIICCDGAADKIRAVDREPDWVVGDLDSLSVEGRTQWGDRLVSCADQETNDLTKAFNFCLSQGWHQLVILGATGLREDHTLANLALLVDFAAAADVVLLSDTGLFSPLLTSARVPAVPGQQVSIFSFDPSTRITSEGLRYPLHALRLSRWWQAALNEAQADTFTLLFEGGPLLVFQTYD